MATQQITLNITTSANMTNAEAIRLYTDFHGYELHKNSNETRGEFAKRVLKEEIKKSIQSQRRIEAVKLVAVPDDITVD